MDNSSCRLVTSRDNHTQSSSPARELVSPRTVDNANSHRYNPTTAARLPSIHSSWCSRRDNSTLDYMDTLEFMGSTFDSTGSHRDNSHACKPARVHWVKHRDSLETAALTSTRHPAGRTSIGTATPVSRRQHRDNLGTATPVSTK
jgi:hypothetical protein